jgi:hypothetical protein
VISRVVGIDPGLCGAIAVLDQDGSYLGAEAIPLLPGKPKRIDWGESVKVVMSICSGHDVILAMERLHAMPMKLGGSQANFARGASVGWYVMALCLSTHLGPDSPRSNRIEHVTPQTWQRVMLDGLPQGDTKQRASLAARGLWPDVPWFGPRPPGGRKLAEGVIDALLIAEWARRKHVVVPVGSQNP